MINDPDQSLDPESNPGQNQHYSDRSQEATALAAEIERAHLKQDDRTRDEAMRRLFADRELVVCAASGIVDWLLREDMAPIGAIALREVGNWLTPQLINDDLLRPMLDALQISECESTRLQLISALAYMAPSIADDRVPELSKRAVEALTSERGPRAELQILSLFGEQLPADEKELMLQLLNFTIPGGVNVVLSGQPGYPQALDWAQVGLLGVFPLRNSLANGFGEITDSIQQLVTREPRVPGIETTMDYALLKRLGLMAVAFCGPVSDSVMDALVRLQDDERFNGTIGNSARRALAFVCEHQGHGSPVPLRLESHSNVETLTESEGWGQFLMEEAILMHLGGHDAVPEVRALQQAYESCPDARVRYFLLSALNPLVS